MKNLLTKNIKLEIKLELELELELSLSFNHAWVTCVIFLFLIIRCLFLSTGNLVKFLLESIKENLNWFCLGYMVECTNDVV